MELVVEALAYLTLFLDVAIVAAGGVFLYEKISGRSIERLEPVKEFLSFRAKELSLALATVATTGSLYLSNIMEWTPCRLCWFQRIFMYPLVVILSVSILFKQDAKDYVLPLAMIGLPIALFHALEQRFSQYLSAGCSIFEVSCSTEYTFHFGYITIPVMAFTAFLGILILMWRFQDRAS